MKPTKKMLAGGAAALVITGLGVTGAALANASTTSPTTSSSSSQSEAGENGKETADDVAASAADTAKVTAAVTAKEKGATVDKVEAKSDGTFEAHATRADGTVVEVHVDKSMAVTKVETDNEKSDGDGETNDGPDTGTSDGDGETNDDATSTK